MKKIKGIPAFVFLLLIASVAILPVAAAPGDNIALNCKIDSVCDMVGEDEAAYMLVDDDPGYATKWCSIDHTGAHLDQGAPDVDGELAHIDNPDDPYHWIILDFESEKTFDSLRLVKASEGERDFGQTQLDAAAFYFEVSNDKATWTKILDVKGNGETTIYEGSFEPVTARYLKLTVPAPEADETNPNVAARLYDLKVFEAQSAAAEATEAAETPAPATTAPQTADPMAVFAIGALISASGAAFATKRLRKK